MINQQIIKILQRSIMQVYWKFNQVFQQFLMLLNKKSATQQVIIQFFLQFLRLFILKLNIFTVTNTTFPFYQKLIVLFISKAFIFKYMNKGQNLLALIAFLFMFMTGEARRLIYVQQLFRHGARYPITAMDNDNSQFVDKIHEQGELTDEGKHMQYILGKIMYQKYWNQLFAGTQFANKYHPSQIYVKSTNVNRTIQSAQSQIQGLLERLPAAKLPFSQFNYSFPPFMNSFTYQEESENNETQFNVFGNSLTNFHSVPIHTQKELFVPTNDNYKYRANPYDEGDFLIKYEFPNCPNQKFWSKENMANQEAMKIKNSDKVTSFLNTLGNVVNKKVKYQDAFHYIDNYECEIFLGRKYLSLFDNPEYLKTSEFIMLTSTLFTFFYTEDQIRISNTRLLQNTIYRMREAQSGNGPKLVLFSAHDTTILSIATALNLISVRCLIDNFFNGVDNSKTCITAYPQFATNIILELWQEDNLSHTVKVLYNGVQKSLPICNNQYSCSFADFQSWANTFYDQNPNNTCGIRENYTKLYIVIGVLSLFILVFVIIEMSKRFKKKIQKKMEQMEQKKGYIENFQEKEGHSQKLQS